jgi:Carboxypeptidase regulatory-like domain
MKTVLLALCLAAASSSSALAQTAGNATLRITVVDPSNAVIVGATITVTGAEPATRAVPVPVARTTDTGTATVAGLTPGRYTIEAAFPGFDPRVLQEVRIRSGENRQVAVLSIPKLEASVSVEQDKQQAAADPNGRSFGTTLTREEIEALSDDPQQLQQQLQDMAGPGAVIRIDGFEGGALPAKAQIRSIRISRDQFAAEYHSAGGVSIEIITQPGIGPIRYFTNLRVRDDAFTGRSPFVASKGPERNTNFGGGMNGTLIKDKSSFGLFVFGTNAYATPNLNAIFPTGTRAESLKLTTPRDNLFVNGQMDYAVTLDQTLRFAYNLSRLTNENLGVGGYDAPERAYSNENSTHNIRVQHFGPLGRRGFWRSRLQGFIADATSVSATEAPTIRVNDFFTSGGAQLAGGEHTKRLNFASDLDYVRGRQSWRGGIVLDGGWYRSDASANYLGTYTFDNMDAYLANRPSNYSRRIGDPTLSFGNVQFGAYIQDDIRPRKNLTLSPGVRFEAQSHVGGAINVGPRFGITWAPSASGQTTLRASTGIFYDWLPTGTYEQSLRVDGIHQQELNIFDPSYPDPGGLGTVPPINKYLLDAGYQLPRITRVSGGVDQGFFKVNRVSVTYSYQQGARLARGANVNAAVDGIRPDPVFRNIVQAISDAGSRQHQVQIDGNLNPGAMLPAFKGPLVSWKRTTLFINYQVTSLRNNTDGAFAIPATGDLNGEWGPAANDVRQRANIAFNNQIVRNVLVGLSVNATSGDAYTLLTGRDDNGDGIFNDRPAGTGRNTLRATGQTNVNLFLAYQIAFGRQATLPPGIGVFGGGAAATVRTVDQSGGRYRVQFFVQGQNLTNQSNYLGYSGTMSSPFFGRPTTVREMRKIDAGINLNF